MPIASWLMAGLMAFVLLGPTVMVAVLISGLSRRGGSAQHADAVRPLPSAPTTVSTHSPTPSSSSEDAVVPVWLHAS